MDRRKSYGAWGVFGAFFLGLLLRLIPAKNSIVDGDVLFFGYDSFYHLRRIFFTTENFPTTLWFDSYLNHPLGFHLTWPPLFDQAVAAVAILFGGGVRSVEMTAALAPPILGAGMIPVVYLLAKKLFGTRVAILSAFILAIDPKHIGRTHFGVADHDVLESLLIFSALILLTYALSERDGNVWFGAAAGALLAAVAYTWLGAPIYMGAILIYATIQIALDLRGGARTQETIAPLAATFGTALLLFLPFWDEPWLVPSFFGALGSLAALGVLCLLSRLFAAKKVTWIAFIPAVAVSGYAAILLGYVTGAAPKAQILLSSGLDYFFLGGAAGQRIAEAAPLHRALDLPSFPFLGFAISVLALGVAISSASRPRLRRDRTLFLIYAAFTLVLAIFQVRFLYLFSISGSILVALLFFWASDRLKGSRRAEPSTTKALSIALLALLLLPSFVGVGEIVRYRPQVSGDWLETLDWMEKNTPATSGYEAPFRAAEYGILSWWDYGNWILYLSERPVVANNFQAGARDAALFFLSEDEEDALAIAEGRDVRYVVTDAKMVYSKLPAIASWADEDPEGYITICLHQDLVTYDHKKRFMGTILARLHLLDCSDLGHFRLVFESNNSVGLIFPTREVKAFERVSGATISGTTPYEKPMGAILEMTSNQGRRFQYYNSAIPVDGRYEITVPYSTDATTGTRGMGPYIVGPVEDSVGGDFREVEVTEEEILSGRVVEANF